jgi:hypothetical protein
MTTERDLEGHVLAMVGAFVSQQKKHDPDNEKVALESAIFLVTTLLCDIHRIADALESQSQPSPMVR